MSESRLVALARQAQNLQPERRANTLSELRGRWSDYVNPYQTPPQQLSDLANPLRWPAMAVEGIQTAVETVPRMLQPGYDYSDTRQAAEDAFNVAGVVGAGSLLGTAAKPSNAVGAFGGGKMSKPSNLVKMYHGTTPDGEAGIMSEGSIWGPAYVSDRYDNALSYAQNNTDTRKSWRLWLTKKIF